jgi:transposase-like protein
MDANAIKSQLSRMERQRRALEQRIQLLQRKELMALPKQLGFDTVDVLIYALAEYASEPLRTRLKSVGVSLSQKSGNGGVDGGGRIKFSADLRARIRKELETGSKSVAEISREYGPSHPTIMGWKREWGMTRPRPRRST